jgi:hypothetical protein
MYTELDNIKHAKKINDYLASNPKATRKSIERDCIVAPTRVRFLANAGYIKLPDPTPYGLRNGLKK